jgi:hypothetical protein
LRISGKIFPPLFSLCAPFQILWLRLAALRPPSSNFWLPAALRAWPRFSFSAFVISAFSFVRVHQCSSVVQRKLQKFSVQTAPKNRLEPLEWHEQLMSVKPKQKD